jgi:ribosomal protein S18 acetylase RimI-like enzyme
MLRYREAYWADREARRAFQTFLRAIHDLDLVRWEAAGQWDDDYRPFSFFDDEGRVVSSVCLYSLEMVVQGSPCRAAQISGVGTLPAYRRRGLNRELTERAIAWAQAEGHAFFFLFADEEAFPFYEACGFRQLAESVPSVTIDAVDVRTGAVTLDPDEASDRQRLVRAVRRRTPVSERLGVLSAPLFLFHAVYPGWERLLHIPDLDVIVACRHHGERLTLFDVVGERIPSLDRLLTHVATPETREVTFRFLPERLDPGPLSWRETTENGLHDRGDIPLRGQRFLFPFTAHA